MLKKKEWREKPNKVTHPASVEAVVGHIGKTEALITFFGYSFRNTHRVPELEVKHLP